MVGLFIKLLNNIFAQNYVKHGYQEIRTPQIVDRSLWEKSGHWDNFGKEMFTLKPKISTYAIKPMNCPCHVQIFKQGLKSYRDLPFDLLNLVVVIVMNLLVLYTV